MTKVGAYCIIRVYTLAFGPDAGPVANIVEPWIMPAALVTLAIGALGALASRSLAGLIVFAVVWSTGSLLIVFGSFDQRSLSAALYYAVHSTFAAATLFLVADLVAGRRAAAGELIPAPPVAQAALLGGVFFLAAIAMAGMPPLSGFIGKLLILDATRSAPGAVWIWAAMLVTSLVIIAGFARAGSLIFWRSEEKAVGADVATTHKPVARASLAPLAAVIALLSTTALMALFAGPVTTQMDRTAAQILDRAGYVRAVLGTEAPARLARMPEGR